MTKMMEDYIARYQRNAARLAETGLYLPQSETAACGVGLVASLDGAPRREVVLAGIEALGQLWHRGAVDADGKTGDGAGLHVQIPQKFFADQIRRMGQTPGAGRLGVGMVFLPRTDLARQERVRQIIEREIIRFGYRIYGWRQAPVQVSAIGDKANATRPEIEQILFEGPEDGKEAGFETNLFIIRRRIEKTALAEQLTDAYLCSLSCRSIIYKGLFLAEQLTAFYPDLLDPRFESNFAIYHQRYSTNTFPSWRLAQPFRMLAHNGEINTLTGNVNWVKTHETRMRGKALGLHVDDVKPVVQPGSSDSAAMDAVFELLARGGRSLPEVKSMLIPEAWEHSRGLPDALRNFYAASAGVMEPWDGPAAICAYDGVWALAGLDRNGLRPMRYAVTGDGLLVVGSEAGMVKIDEKTVQEKGRVGPGGMIAVNLREGKLYHDAELKAWVAESSPLTAHPPSFAFLPPRSADAAPPPPPPSVDAATLTRRQLAAGWTMEDLETVLQPMAEQGKEAIGSMGDDTPLAVLSAGYRGLHHYFRANFSQVTNPSIDSLRERYVMSLTTRLGNFGDILEAGSERPAALQLPSPILLGDEFQQMRAWAGDAAVEIPCLFDVSRGPLAMRDALREVMRKAAESVKDGAAHLILTDDGVDEQHAAIPMILAAGAVHSHLQAGGRRAFASLNVRTAEALDVHSFAVLIGVGVTSVTPWLALETILERNARGLYGDIAPSVLLENYRKAVTDGLLKVMAKMGISVIGPYRGGYYFETVGLSRALAAEFFPGLPSRVSGVGVTGIQQQVEAQHRKAWAEAAPRLSIGGFYRLRAGEEQHAWEAEPIHLLQTAVATDSFAVYRRYARMLHKQRPVNPRDLLDFIPAAEPVSVDEVESITGLRKRLVSPGISLGAISPQAHETLAIAMNRIGSRSDSGEGGEDSARYVPHENGDNASSAIKQIASGRFGVTAEYLNNCREIEIKIAQGAKPGEGGHLPGFKVTSLIARLRHSTPGVTLISPPPHHDIYSIEDLAQLIYDLKQINPDAEVCVKLVARAGIGAVAAGVAKAHADVILVSGHSGGTGASPLTSIKYTGVPWEIGLAETHQVLSLNGLRAKVRLRVDGGIKTGRDVVIAAMLGAEEYGVGTASLVAMGCLMVRQCHSNTCPVGICTQNPELIRKFSGTPEKVVNLFSFIAEDVREILASLGVRSLAEVIGRTELLHQVSRGAAHLDDLDLNPLLARMDEEGVSDRPTVHHMPAPKESLNDRMIADAEALFLRREKMQLQYNIRNTDRAIGARVSSRIVRQFGMTGLGPNHLTVRMRGSAGQSLGAFAVCGLKLEVLGEANDYVGKGLSGGRIVVRPIATSPLASQNNAIIGNTALYGATSGELYVAGRAGERFAVRNSGAVAVVEGCGANGCEYMTGGRVAILGEVGDNFAAGMTGGMAFVLDRHGDFQRRLNPESVGVYALDGAAWEQLCRDMLEAHLEETRSLWAENLLLEWGKARSMIRHIVPHEILPTLPTPPAETLQPEPELAGV